MHISVVLRIQHATAHQGQKVLDRLDDIAKRAFLNGNVVEGTYTQTKRVETDDPNQIKLSWKTTSDVAKGVAAE